MNGLRISHPGNDEVGRLKARVAELEAEKAELLAACKAAVSLFTEPVHSPHSFREKHRMVFDAIAKAEGDAGT